MSRLVMSSPVLFPTTVLSSFAPVPDIVPPGPGLWKLNTSILEDEGYVLAVSNFWSG